MVSRPFRCSESRLRSFLDAELPEPEHLELASHLDNCAACRHTLERLAAGSRLWTDLRQLAFGPPEGARQGAGATETFGSRPLDGELGEARASLEFLAPSDAASSLGRLGPYEIRELLGSGGFGIVLKAFDAALGRAVAIKVLSPQLANSAAARGRFAREARAAAAVVHEHVVAIHAVDSCNGLPYLVMPYIAGRSLQERVDREGTLGVKETLRIGMQTALGLAAAHAQGLVHRDVKPSNILLENGVERVKLTDFGLARAIDDASLTQSGVVAGTPQYMSPEQAQGAAIDHRSDLFSLGSVLYFACAGHSPFRANSTPAVLRRVCDEPPRPLREVNPDVPAWLAQIIERLHAKDPAGRFQTAEKLAEVLGDRLAALQGGAALDAPLECPRVRSRWRPQFGRKQVMAFLAIVPAVALALTAIEKPPRFGGLAAFTFPARGVERPAPGDSREDRSIRVIQEADAIASVVGSGNPATKTWELAGFDRIVIGSTFETVITKADGFKVTATADDNVLDHIHIVKEGTTLKIGLEPRTQYRLKTKLTADIKLPSLLSLKLGGASKTTLKGFRSEKGLDLQLSGASKLGGELAVEKAEFEVSGASTLNFILEANTLFVLASGASSVNLHGRTEHAALEASGASHLSLAGLAVKTAEVKLSGVSHATLDVREKLSYDISSLSHLTYLRDPATLGGKKSGGSTISRRRSSGQGGSAETRKAERE